MAESEIEYLAEIVKQTAEKFPYTITYTGRLPDGATVASCAVAGLNLYSNATDNSVISNTVATVTTTTASVFVQAGTSDIRYKVTYTATLSDGSILEDDILLIVKNK